MTLLPAALLGLIYAYSTTAHEFKPTSPRSFSLSDEISNFVPCCAKPCFLSFLEANFPASVCTKTPSLECLCSHNSVSGFTIGEAAIQCLKGGQLQGLCTGEDTSQATGLKAFNMCAGQTGALPNTHPTLTATLISLASTPTLVAPSSTTTSSSTKRTSTASNTSFIPTGILTATSRTSTATGSSIITSNLASSAPANPTASAEAATSGTTGTLTKPQITGIAVGSVGGVLAVVALLLFFCLKRRRQAEREKEDSDSFLLPFQLEPGNKTTTSGGFRGPTEEWTGQAAPPLRDGPETIRAVPRSMNTRFPIATPGAIGVAISPDSKFRPDRGVDYDRRQSVLLPPKPTLEPFVNPRGSPPRPDRKITNPIVNPVPQTGFALTGPNNQRTSTMTVFEEDPQDYHDSTPTYPAPVLFPQSQGPSKTRQNIAPINTNMNVAPLNINRLPMRTSSRGAGGQNYSRQMSQPLPTGSSNYSNQSFMRDSTQSRQPGFANSYGRAPPPPQPQFRPYRTPQPVPQPVPQPQVKTRRDSEGSLTSIESNDGPLQPRTPDNRNSALSPVVESPASRRGRDLYPPIPGTESSPTTQLQPTAPLFTQRTKDNMPADLAVYDAFWRPKPQTDAAPPPQPNPTNEGNNITTANKRLSQIQKAQDFERQRRLRMSQATNTSQAQNGRNQGPRTGRLPLLPALQIPLPAQAPTTENFPSAFPKDQEPEQNRKARRTSVMDRPRPNADYVRGSGVSTDTANTALTTASANSLLDRRGMKMPTPITTDKRIKRVDGRGQLRTGEGDTGSGRSGGGYDSLLSPTERNVTPRRIGNDLYLDMT